MTKKPLHQIIYDTNNKPAFAVLPYPEYEKMMTLLAEKLDQSSPLLSEDGLTIRLPHGGPDACIDLIVLANYCYERSLISIAIGARQQRLSKFAANQVGALDPLIRMCFLKPDSPYRNTMQATNDVVDALVETGLFKRTKRDFNNAKEGQQFYRPVLALDVNEDAVKAFVASHPKPNFKIPLYYWANEKFNSGLFDKGD
ncbi:hypothetical protein [Metapseudomonas otitidis]|uniref:hypothetical protein n=1 Tax=Metapseudomonas otitidis TaxID=319939 RepID=UPI00209B9163|nr:hypothetical protein [Pseudomonas otitidis]MCO7557605.1 hypothetical protein [Pseudomonas otitidis]